MTNPSLSAGQNREPPVPGPGAPAKGREKFLSAKIQRNPLKLLVSDESIQGNPIAVNLDFRRQMAQTKKTQIGSIGLTAAVHPCETEPKPAPSKCERSNAALPRSRMNLLSSHSLLSRFE